jgi:hypothetical protein
LELILQRLYFVVGSFTRASNSKDEDLADPAATSSLFWMDYNPQDDQNIQERWLRLFASRISEYSSCAIRQADPLPWQQALPAFILAMTSWPEPVSINPIWTS